jgi:phosphatidylinositol-3-phosphatase
VAVAAAACGARDEVAVVGRMAQEVVPSTMSLPADGTTTTATATPESAAPTITASPSTSTSSTGPPGGPPGSSPASVATTRPPVATVAPTVPVGPPPSPPCGWRSGPPPIYQHVVWTWMENRRFSEVIGNPNAPYETQLAAACGTATAFAHAGQPSLPNYIAATSGDTQGIVDNGHPLSHPLLVDNVFRQVRAAGGTARTYAESMPAPCWSGTTDRYTFITNPALYYVSPADAAACQADDVPMGGLGTGALARDIDAGRLPSLALVVPDLCSNTHDCPVAVGDAWLAQWVPRILAGTNYRTQATAVFVVWDEFTPMPFIVVSPTTAPGTVVTSPLDHYSFLRTTEELLGLPFLGRAAAAVSMRPLYGL